MAEKNEATLLLRIKQAGGDILDKATEKYLNLKNMILASVAAIGAAIVNSLAQYREQEQAIEALGQSMVTAGMFSTQLRDSYVAQAEALSKVTLFGDEQIINAQAILQSYIGNIEVTEELTKATLDLAQKTGSLDTAATQMGKAIGTSTNGLAKQGIKIDENASKQEKLKQAVDGVNSKFEGQSLAAAKGLGVWSLLSKAIGEVSEDFGKKLAPSATSVGQILLDYVSKYGTPITEFFGSTLNKAIAAVSILFVGFGTVLESIGAQVGMRIALWSEVIPAALKFNFKEVLRLQNQFDTEYAAEQIRILKESNTKIESLMAAFREDSSAKTAADAEKDRQSKLAASELAAQDLLNADIKKQEARLVAQEMELALIGANESQKLAIKQKALDEEIKKETDAKTKLSLLQQRSANMEQQIEARKNEKFKADRSEFLSHISTMQNSHNKTMAGIGKAAAIASIWINTYEMATKSFNFGSGIGGPYVGAAFAALAIAAGAAQAAKVAGVQLAEGGIVRASPGGTQAVIGEGGQDEAVIPLGSDEAISRLGGGGMTINFYGPIMGDEAQAMEFARALDKNLLKLRRSNEAVSFDEDLT